MPQHLRAQPVPAVLGQHADLDVRRGEVVELREHDVGRDHHLAVDRAGHPDGAAVLAVLARRDQGLGERPGGGGRTPLGDVDGVDDVQPRGDGVVVVRVDLVDRELRRGAGARGGVHRTRATLPSSHTGASDS
ncbi:hypothetical protein [Nocardioides sp. TF02-7]|uniref:hypothetical protein n=1 Tax=Nocardioides sp. TF02-7 TaxID=2917724 RepID=UPI001F06E7A8|nr:hypothetical protein [Nocardioides sp. TF02-7]UMG91437.1 hypothetical protein MF408_14985 [Nocardioides sp. TF02-7]